MLVMMKLEGQVQIHLVILTPDLVLGSAGGTLEWNWPWLVTESGLADMMSDVL